MSRHEGVSCDSCLKGNFRGKRYKCLVCYDYDLCGTCYEAGATTTRHTTDHPMQCILTRSDFDLYYGGEAISVEQPQSYTCPFCGKMGFTEPSLQEHVTSDHADASSEVVCPVCAALPGGEPNHVTDDFVAHLTLEHRSPRDLDEPSGSRHVRRIPHPGRGMSSARARRSQMQFSSSGGLASLSPSNRESMDPITELLSQLSGVRRTANLTQPNTASQLQQLHMQLQLERQQAQARQQLERLPRRHVQGGSTANGNSGGSGTSALSTTSGISIPTSSVPQSHYTVILEPSPSLAVSSTASQFLLSRCTEPSVSESEQQALDVERADRSMFIQELLLSTLAGELTLDDRETLVRAKGVASEDGASPDRPFSNLPLSSNKGDNSLVCSCSGQAGADANPPASHHKSASRNGGNPATTNPRRQANPSASSSGSGRSGTRSNGAAGANNPSQPSSSSGRGSPSAPPQRHASRDARVTNRTAGNREGGSSPSSTRRKLLKHADDRNKSSEPPPH